MRVAHGAMSLRLSNARQWIARVNFHQHCWWSCRNGRKSDAGGSAAVGEHAQFDMVNYSQLSVLCFVFLTPMHAKWAHGLKKKTTKKKHRNVKLWRAIWNHRLCLKKVEWQNRFSLTKVNLHFSNISCESECETDYYVKAKFFWDVMDLLVNYWCF